MELCSERLYMKAFSEKDFALFYSVFSNERVMQYALMNKYESEKDIVPYFNMVMAHNTEDKNRKGYEFAVYLHTDDSFIGFADIELHTIHAGGGCGEIGYFLLPEFWGSGYATELTRTLVAVCFEDLKLHRVSARCNANNRHSERVLIKVGMIQEGELRKVRYKNNQWENEKLYGILVEDWNNTHARNAVVEPLPYSGL